MRSSSAKRASYLSHLEPLRAALEAYCRRHLSDQNALEDVLQEVVAKTFRDFDRYREGTNFRAWIFRYLNLEILEWNRCHRTRPGFRLTDPDAVSPRWSDSRGTSATNHPWEPETVHEIPDTVLQHCDEALAAAIDALSHSERSVLLLRAIGEFKYREIAGILDVPVGTVMSHLSRAREKLRTRLRGNAGDSFVDPAARAANVPLTNGRTGEPR